MAQTESSVREAAWLRPAVAVAAIGWGANQFAPLIVFYQQHGVSTTATGIIFGLYAVGLIPALLVGGRWSDRAGRKPVVGTALLLSLAATTMLVLGEHVHALLFARRFAAGVSSGLAFGTGAAWIREASATASGRHLGARRATIAMTTGFGLGPLVAGLIGQWAPDPQLWPYVPNLALCLVALILVARAANGRPPARGERSTPPSRAEVNRHLLRVSTLFAPWVFGTAAIALAYLPGLVATGAQQLAFAAVATALPAFVGVLVQPVIARSHGDRPAAALLLPAMGVTVVALAVAVWAAAASTMGAVILAEIALGAAYGVTQFAGLANIQHIAPPALLGYATSAYQALAYIGFALPYLLSLAHAALGWSPTLGLTFVTALAVAATLALLRTSRGR